MSRPRIVFATMAAGGGHVATAEAMAQGVEAIAPGVYDLPVTDLIHDLGFVAFDARHKAQWRWMLARPWTARWGQRVIDELPPVTRAVLRRSLGPVARALATRFAPEPTDLIVANHGFLAFALAGARRRYGLDDRLTCLVSLGGEGVGGRATGVVDALAAMTPTPQVDVVTGRNKALARELGARGSPDLVVRGFVSDMADHLAAYDVVIGKAGPASVMEAVAVGRPMLVTGYASLNEVKELRWLQARGLGHAISGPADPRNRVEVSPADTGAGLT